MAEFDPYSAAYRDLVTSSVRVSGESTEYFAAYKAKYIARSFAFALPKSILDYGCGVGALAEQLKREIPAARIDGFDPSEDSLNRLSGKLREQGTFSANLHELPGQYDMVVMANVLHHVPLAERDAVLDCAYKKLKAGGRLVVFEHNPWNPLTQWAVSQCPFDDDAILLPSAEVRRRLASAGFSQLQRDFVVFFPAWLGALRPLEPSLGWLPAGAQYAFSAVRPA